MDEHLTDLTVFGVSTREVWRLLVAHLDDDDLVETAPGFAVRNLLGFRPLAMGLTFIHVECGAGLFDKVVADTRITAYRDEVDIRTLERHRVLFDRGAALFHAWEGPAGELRVELGGVTVFERTLRWNEAGFPDPENRGKKDAFEDAVAAHLATLVPRLGVAAAVFDHPLRATLPPAPSSPDESNGDDREIPY